MLFKIVMYTTKNLKNKAILNLKQYCMPCYVALSNISHLMHTKMYMHYSLIRRLASYKVCMFVHYCIVRVIIVIVIVIFRQGVHSVLYGIVVNFMGIKILQILLSFLSMVFYEAVYTWCLRYNICSAWLLDSYKKINLLLFF